MKNIAVAPLPSSTTSMLLPKSCNDVKFWTFTAEYNANGPARPINLSCSVVEESIFGLTVPGCGTGIEIVTFKVGGGVEVRSWAAADLLEFAETTGRIEGEDLQQR